VPIMTWIVMRVTKYGRSDNRKSLQEHPRSPYPARASAVKGEYGN
jgi:hypothetical protein